MWPERLWIWSVLRGLRAEHDGGVVLVARVEEVAGGQLAADRGQQAGVGRVDADPAGLLGSGTYGVRRTVAFDTW